MGVVTAGAPNCPLTPDHGALVIQVRGRNQQKTPARRLRGDRLQQFVTARPPM
jgi:hypothetical protein